MQYAVIKRAARRAARLFKFAVGELGQPPVRLLGPKPGAFDRRVVVTRRTATSWLLRSALSKGSPYRTFTTVRAFRAHLRVRGSSLTAQQRCCLRMRIP
jgi:hypothetical protein